MIKIVWLCFILVLVKRSDGSIQWHPYDCDENDWKAIRDKGLFTVTLLDDHLLIYSKEQVIKQNLPVYTRNYRGIKEEVLVGSVPDVANLVETSPYFNFIDATNMVGYIHHFNNDTNGPRTKLISRTADTLIVQDLTLYQDNDKGLKLFAYIGDKDEKLTEKLRNQTYARLSAISDQRTDNWYEVAYSDDDRNMSIRMKTYSTMNAWHVKEQKRDYKTNFSIIYYVPHASVDNLDVNWLELDTKLQVHIGYHSLSPTNESSSSTVDHQVTIRLEELLGCRVPIKHQREIKGVFYFSFVTQPKFYVFINSFYLTISDDLVETGFNLNDSSVYAKARYPQFDDHKGMQQIEFVEKLTFKYIKTLKDRTLLSYFSVTSFDLNLEMRAENDSQLTAKHERPRLVQRCVQNTLQIDQSIYCLNAKNYAFLAKLEHFEDDAYVRKHLNSSEFEMNWKSIASIFQASKIEYDETQVLQLVFNYKDNMFVLMTSTDLFAINYDLLYVDNEHNIKVKTKTALPSKHRHFRKRNCLFVSNCDPKLIHTTRMAGNHSVTNGPQKIVLFPGFVTLIVSLLLLIVLAVLIIFVLKKIEERRLARSESTSPNQLRSKELKQTSSTGSFSPPRPDAKGELKSNASSVVDKNQKPIVPSTDLSSTKQIDQLESKAPKSTAKGSPTKLTNKTGSEPKLAYKTGSELKLNKKTGSEPKLNKKTGSEPKLNKKTGSEPKLNKKTSSELKLNKKTGSEPKLNKKTGSVLKLNKKTGSKPKLNRKSGSKSKLNIKSWFRR